MADMNECDDEDLRDEYRNGFFRGLVLAIPLSIMLWMVIFKVVL
jgi:hypothetical protein